MRAPKASTISTRTVTGLHGYNVVKNDKGNIVFDKHIDFND